MSSTKFSDELVRYAVAQITERGYPVRDAAERLSVNQYPLYSWKEKFAKALSDDAERSAVIRRLRLRNAGLFNMRPISYCTGPIAPDLPCDRGKSFVPPEDVERIERLG